MCLCLLNKVINRTVTSVMYALKHSVHCHLHSFLDICLSSECKLITILDDTSDRCVVCKRHNFNRRVCWDVAVGVEGGEHTSHIWVVDVIWVRSYQTYSKTQADCLLANGSPQCGGRAVSCSWWCSAGLSTLTGLLVFQLFSVAALCCSGLCLWCVSGLVLQDSNPLLFVCLLVSPEKMNQTMIRES